MQYKTDVGGAYGIKSEKAHGQFKIHMTFSVICYYSILNPYDLSYI